MRFVAFSTGKEEQGNKDKHQDSGSYAIALESINRLRHYTESTAICTRSGKTIG
jgi:hypothetical protein